MGLVKTRRERTWKMATRQEGEIILTPRTPKTARGWKRNLLMLAKRAQGSHDVLTCGFWRRWKSALMLMVALRQWCIRNSQDVTRRERHCQFMSWFGCVRIFQCSGRLIVFVSNNSIFVSEMKLDSCFLLLLLVFCSTRCWSVLWSYFVLLSLCLVAREFEKIMN